MRLQGAEPPRRRRDRAADRGHGLFFDTELLLIAERNGYRVRDVPVLWRDDPDTRVRIVKTAVEDLRGMVAAAGRRQCPRRRAADAPIFP